MTVADLIYAGYRIAGILAEAGRGYSESERADGLAVLNAMLDGWKADRLMVYAILRSVFELRAGKAEYTAGLAGADFPIERPEKIERAGLLWPGNPELETPLSILTDAEWADVRLKGMPGEVPQAVYYEPVTPNGRLRVWPAPSVAARLALYTWRTVGRLESADDPITLPASYQEAIEYNLAVRLAARFPERQKLSQTAVQLGTQALMKVRTINTPRLVMTTESAAQGSGGNPGWWDPYTNSYR